MTFVEEVIEPQRVTKLVAPLFGEIEVSSIHYRHIFSSRPENATVVFFSEGLRSRSEDRGTYDDHDRVVEEIKQKYNATVKS